MNTEKLQDTIKKAAGENAAKSNPFLVSKEFVGLMKAVAAIAKVILAGSMGPSEAINGIMSVVVTFLKNVPDVLWKPMMEAANDSKSPVAADMVQHMNALRNYGGDDRCQFVEVDDLNLDLPEVTAKMPNKPC